VKGPWLAVRSTALGNTRLGWVRARRVRLLNRTMRLEVDLSKRELVVRDVVVLRRFRHLFVFLGATLAVLALATGESMDVASGVLVVATSAALATAPWGGRRWRSALATVGLLSASCVLVSMGGGTVELAFHFFVTIALVMLYQDGFPFLIAVGFVAVYALVSAVMESLGVWPPAETWSNPWLRATVGELLILATATANLANWRLNEDSRAEAERSFQQLYDGQRAVVRELQQSQRLKDELYNVVSHELRTPLTGILGFGELLLTRDDRLTPAQRKEHLGRILREARRLQRVVDNLVYSSKVIQQDGSAAADLRGVVRAVVEDLDAGVPAPLIAARFHNGLAEATVAGCQAVRDATGLEAVALSGGVFQNLLLLERTVARLELRGFRVLVHSRVPPNDGGIAYGQVAVAAATMG
jgi:signal transduction histidine kinase